MRDIKEQAVTETAEAQAAWHEANDQEGDA